MHYVIEYLISFFLAYFEGAKWFFSLMKTLLWDNPVYFYTTNNWILFFVYILYLKRLAMGAFFETITWERLFRNDFGGFKGLFILIEWFIIIIGAVALFHNKLWIPYPEFWLGAKKFLAWVYVDGLASAWNWHWFAGVCYFLIVDWCLGVAWPIHITGMIHGDYPLISYKNTIDRNALSQHNTFMQLVNIERAIGKMGKK